MDSAQTDRAEAQLRAGVYARLSETYDAAESVPTQIERGTDHARRRGWIVAATFKDDGFSGFKEITRDGFGELIAAIKAGAVDVVIVRDIDRLTRNLTDWNAFEKVCVRHGVRLSAYTGGDLDLSTAEGAYYGGMETLRARRESAVKSARVREAQDREARKGRQLSGGQRWFGYTRIYANPDEPNPKKRHILREDINLVEADAIRDAAMRVLEHGESVGSIVRDWTARGIKPVAAKQWWPTSIVGTLTSARLAGLMEWQGKKYPATQWPAIIDVDTHERLVKLFADPARRKHVVRAPAHLLSGIATCPKCGRGADPGAERAGARVRGVRSLVPRGAVADVAQPVILDRGNVVGIRRERAGQELCGEEHYGDNLQPARIMARRGRCTSPSRCGFRAPVCGRAMGHGMAVVSIDPPSSILGGEAFLSRLYNAYKGMQSSTGQRLEHGLFDRLGRTRSHLRPCSAPFGAHHRTRPLRSARMALRSTARATGSRPSSCRRGWPKARCSTRSTDTSWCSPRTALTQSDIPKNRTWPDGSSCSSSTRW